MCKIPEPFMFSKLPSDFRLIMVFELSINCQRGHPNKAQRCLTGRTIAPYRQIMRQSCNHRQCHEYLYKKKGLTLISDVYRRAKKHKALGNREGKNPRKKTFTPSGDASESPASCFITSVELWCPNQLFSPCREKGIPSENLLSYTPMIRYQGWFWYISWLGVFLKGLERSKEFYLYCTYNIYLSASFFPLDPSRVLESWILGLFSAGRGSGDSLTRVESRRGHTDAGQTPHLLFRIVSYWRTRACWLAN